MALSPDGSKLYVALNGANKLGVIDTATDTVLDEIPVGNAPRQVELADNGTVAYVSNEGGRPANSSDTFTNLSDGTPIVSNCSTGGAITGTVSVVSLNSGRAPTRARRPRRSRWASQPTALYQDGSALFVANSNDDSFSVIDERTNTRRPRRCGPTRSPAPAWAATPTRSTCPTPTTCWSASAATTRSPCTATAACTGRCASSGCSRPTGTPSRSSPTRRSARARSWSPTTRASAPGGPRRRSTRAPTRTRRPPGHNTYDDTGSVTTFTMPTSGWQIGHGHPDRLHRQRLESDQADQPGRLRHRAEGHPGPPRRLLADQAHRRDRQGEPDLRPGPRVDLGRATAIRPTPSSAHRSRRTPTRSPDASAIWTTSTTRARSRPTVTTGSSRPRPTTTSRRSSGRSTAPIRHRAVTRSPTSATASSGMPPRRPA